MNAYEVTYKETPRARKTLTAVRFALTLDEARENADQVLGREQGYTVVSVTPTADPRPPYRKGDRVQVTGEGRTANWARYLHGTVEETWGGRIYIRWDGARFSDEMTPDEIEKVAHVS